MRKNGTLKEVLWIKTVFENLMLRDKPTVKGIRLRRCNNLFFQVSQFLEILSFGKCHKSARLRCRRIVGKNCLARSDVNNALRQAQFMKRARRANQKVDGIVFELFVRIDGIERNRNKPVSRQLRVQKLECGFEGLGAEFRVKRINDTDFDFCLFSGERGCGNKNKSGEESF